MRYYEMGDIIRFEDSSFPGLYEITAIHKDSIYDYSVTMNECNSEQYAKHSDMIFVCSVGDRKDI